SSRRRLLRLLLQAPHRLTRDLLENLRVDVRQPLDVETAAAEPVLAELSEKLALGARAAREVDRQVRLARREAGDEPLDLAAALVRHVMVAEADDARTPHLRLRLRHLAQQGDERLAIRAARRVQPRQELRHARRRRLRLVLGPGHRTSSSFRIRYLRVA